MFVNQSDERLRLVQQRIEFHDLQLPVTMKDERLLADIGGQIRISQQELHHPRMDQVIRVLLVHVLDIELRREFGGFEIDIVNQVLRLNDYGLQGPLRANDQRSDPMRVFVAPGAGVILIIKNEDIQIVPPPLADIGDFPGIPGFEKRISRVAHRDRGWIILEIRETVNDSIILPFVLPLLMAFEIAVMNKIKEGRYSRGQ